MLPNVVAENGVQSLRDRVVLIRSGHDLHFALGVSRQPHPSAAELSHPGGVEFFLKSLEVAKSFLNHFADRAGGIASAFRLLDVPEHRVIHVAAALIAHRAAYILRYGVKIAN